MTIDPRPVVIAAARSPIAASGGRLSGCTVEDLAGPVIGEVLSRGLPGEAMGPGSIDAVLLGNCMGPGGNVARVSALAAGLSVDTAALTIDQQCSSGLAAVVAGAALVQADGGAVIAGGVESASTAPLRMWRDEEAGEPRPYERAPFTPTGWPDPDMGVAADLLAEQRGISRARQDEYAARSHERAVRSQQQGIYEGELVDILGVRVDDRPRTAFDAERLARFPAAFRDGGSVTAANSCGINDGCAAIVVVDPELHDRHALPGMRILSTAIVGVDPQLPGLGIVPAARTALQRAGLGWHDIDVIEFNEAFAAQILACCDELGIDDARVCAQGGALALGHPWGASGAVLITRLFSQLVVQQSGRVGLAAIAGGGGQGVAVVVERCP